jgi:general secretion pathway protein L
VRERLFRRRDQVFVGMSAASGDEARIDVVVESGGPTASAAVMLGEPDAADKIGVALASSRDADVTLVLPRSVALTKRLWLPAAAESALPDVLRHELDRLTPFPIDEIVFDHHVRSRATDKIEVDVVVARRDALAAALASIERLGLRATAVTAAGGDGRPLRVNLVPQRPRIRLPFAKLPVRPAIAAAAGVLALAALYVPLLRYDALLARYEQTTARAREQAVAARSELDDQEALLARTDYLAERRRHYIAPIEMLLELTQQLPEHTWIARASFTAREVQLQGESATASELLQIVESMERLQDAQFQAPVARSSDSGKEQFSIVALPARPGS